MVTRSAGDPTLRKVSNPTSKKFAFKKIVPKKILIIFNQELFSVRITFLKFFLFTINFGKIDVNKPLNLYLTTYLPHFCNYFELEDEISSSKLDK